MTIHDVLAEIERRIALIDKEMPEAQQERGWQRAMQLDCVKLELLQLSATIKGEAKGRIKCRSGEIRMEVLGVWAENPAP